MTNFLLVLEYDGTDFEGWQSQGEDHRTVQATLRRALERVTGAPAQLTGAGRTDSGVHAEAQLANVHLETELGPDTLLRALNAILPHDLSLRRCEIVPETFHARRCARTKLYRYRIWNARERSALRARWVYGVGPPLDVPAMQRAAEQLVGCHDFASFRAAGSSTRTSVRTIERLEISGEAGGEIVFEVEGPGFLRHMVRNLVGTLLEVGRGRRAPDSISELLVARDRGLAGPTAPARGLCLVRVDWDLSDPGLAPPPPDLAGSAPEQSADLAHSPSKSGS